MSHKRESGFTLIELIVVVMIIGVLAAIAIPAVINYRRRGYDTQAYSDARNVFTTAQAYFSSFGYGVVVDKPKLDEHGFNQSPAVVMNIANGSSDGLDIRTYHQSGFKTYHLMPTGSIWASQ